MFQGVDLNFSDQPARRSQTVPGPNVVAGGGDITALDARVTALETAGAVFGKTRTVTATGNTGIDDYLLLCDATSGAITITLPSVLDSADRILVFKKIDASVNAVTIDGNSGDLIDGNTTESLAAQYDALTLVCDGTDWWII